MATPEPVFFEEGQEYVFMVNSRVYLPPDDEAFFVLLSPFNTKHLLQEKPYFNYKILPGQQIKCRIDKINCSGKIYLEPEHPCYKEKNIYEFPVKGVEHLVNSGGKPEKMLLVEDCWHNYVYINSNGASDDADEAQTIKCTVDRIKKGKLYLTPVNKLRHTASYEPGEEYEFRIEGVVTLTKAEEYFELKSESGNVHYLRMKFFKDYHFKIGDIIKCRYVAKPSLYRSYLEPVHPYYKIGEIYDFLYTGIASHINVSGEEIKMMTVSDGSDKDYFVSCNDLSTIKTEPGSKIRCLLKDIRMGRLVLECIL